LNISATDPLYSDRTVNTPVKSVKSLNETTAVIYAPEILSNFPTKKTNANGTGYTTVYAPVESDRFLSDTNAVTYAPEILADFFTKKTNTHETEYTPVSSAFMEDPSLNTTNYDAPELLENVGSYGNNTRQHDCGIRSFALYIVIFF